MFRTLKGCQNFCPENILYSGTICSKNFCPMRYFSDFPHLYAHEEKITSLLITLRLWREGKVRDNAAVDLNKNVR